MKVKRVGRRGTVSYVAENTPLNWAGDAYRKKERESLEKVPKNLTMHLGRGHRTTKAGDLPKPNPRPSSEGMTRITNRGTKTRRSKNKGSQV